MPASSTKTNGFLTRYADSLLIVIFSVMPLFMHFPYRVNIFLSWEGAYRLYLDQIPYKDFGLPLGFGFWLMPALFFKIFGPALISLVKAQVFLNIIAGFSFANILKKLEISKGIRVASVLTFCLSYILINFWPWYNNSVIIYEITGLNFLFGFLMNYKLRFLQLFAACFFLFLSFFTKQDGGALAFLIASALVFYCSYIEKKWSSFFIYLFFYLAIGMVFFLPFLKYNIGYWFNHGQPPHSARISVKDLLSGFLGESQWIKFYILLIIILLMVKIKNWKTFITDKKYVLFFILTIGILAEASIFQVTSYTPPDNNIFYHSFAIAYILAGVTNISGINFSKYKNLCFLLLGICLWWSGMYWKYLERITDHLFPAPEQTNVSATGENVINMHTYMINLDTTHYEDESTWKEITGLKAFKNIYLPPSTIAGIQRLQAMPVFKNKNAVVLNMTELTPLDYELGYKLETGTQYPLWDHLGVCMFNKQLNEFCDKIANKKYDIIMFEYIPSLNNFYPFKIHNSLMKYYKKIDSFLAPRRPTDGTIEIYVKE